MNYAIILLAVFAIQGIRSQNCTRTNRQSNICAKPCDPSQNKCNRSEDCVCDGDCGYSCVKKDLHCPRLSRINNGRLKLKNTTFRSVAVYKCRSPYKVVGSKKRACRGNGTWDGQEPTCKMMCQVPRNILNGSMKYDSLEVGQKVTYTCSPGFIMEGRSTLTCARTGTWNRDEPKCICKRNNREPWKFCKKGCNPGTAGNCKNNQECICDGDCGYSCVLKALECGRPSKLENGKHKYSSRRLGSVVKYQCNEPYTLIGPKKRTCRGIRRWDGTDPLCKIICKDPGNVVHSTKLLHRRRNYEEDYLEVGDRVEYKCFPGYEMEGSKDLICGSKGEWNKDKPKCKLPTCDPPRLSHNVDFRLSSQKRKRSFSYQDKVLLKCRTGYYQNGMLGLLTCGQKGRWASSSFTCSPKSCGRPQIPRNGNVKSHVFTFRSKVYFECNPGFRLIGDKYRQCQANQEWSGRAPTCKTINCGRLSTPHKVSIVSETHTGFGGYVKYQCKEKGYELIGSETRVCQNDEQWSGVTPSCQIVNCGDPGTPANGKRVHITNGFHYGSSVKFACDANYSLEGSGKITCEETKEWSAFVPRCRASCSNPGEPVNGDKKGDDFKHGKTITFRCHDDYERVGGETIQCIDGKWSAKIPQCKVISCGDPGTPQHGRQTKVVNNFAFRGTVAFQCDDGYTLFGKSFLSCQRSKMWDGDVPKCLASCSDPGRPRYGITIGSGFEHDSVVKFKCLPYRVLEGASESKCVNGRWTAQLPNCKDCNESLSASMTDKCQSNEKWTICEIKLGKKSAITAASIQPGDDRGKVKNVHIRAHPDAGWVKIGKRFMPPFSKEEKLRLSQPVITQSIQVLLETQRELSVFPTPRVYGCDAVHWGCIIPGSAVLFKEGGKYREGRFVSVKSSGEWEIVKGKVFKSISRGDVILDEKPTVSQLPEGAIVVGTDSRGNLKKGKIKRSCSSTQCTIETNGKEWHSKLENVRVSKGELCK